MPRKQKAGTLVPNRATTPRRDITRTKAAKAITGALSIMHANTNPSVPLKAITGSKALNVMAAATTAHNVYLDTNRETRVHTMMSSESKKKKK